MKNNIIKNLILITKLMSFTSYLLMFVHIDVFYDMTNSTTRRQVICNSERMLNLMVVKPIAQN